MAGKRTASLGSGGAHPQQVRRAYPAQTPPRGGGGAREGAGPNAAPGEVVRATD